MKILFIIAIWFEFMGKIVWHFCMNINEYGLEVSTSNKREKMEIYFVISSNFMIDEHSVGIYSLLPRFLRKAFPVKEGDKHNNG